MIFTFTKLNTTDKHVYRKPAFTGTVIPYSANHPIQHKYAAIIYLYNRLRTYQLHNEEYNHEINFTHNNSFRIQPLRTPEIKQNQTIHSVRNT